MEAIQPSLEAGVLPVSPPKVSLCQGTGAGQMWRWVWKRRRALCWGRGKLGRVQSLCRACDLARGSQGGLPF